MTRPGALLLVALCATTLASLAAAQQAEHAAGSLSQYGRLRLRREITALMTQPGLARHRSLFLQALAAMQAAPWQSKDSYYQQSAIHGVPFLPFDGAVNPASPYVEGQVFLVNGLKLGRHGGYCPHQNTQFPTWHRAQLLSFEAALRKHAVAVAAQYRRKADAARWRAAARELAMPYFDWASPRVQRNGLPVFFSQAQISVVAPGGRKLIPNPLRSFTLPSAAPFPPYGSCKNKRKGDLECTTFRNEIRDINLGLIRALESERFAIAMAMASNNWTCVADSIITDEEAATKRCNDQSSLETVHNTFHDVIGGWLSRIPHASYDPIFWLHHCFIDKLFALWQLDNPNVWVEPQMDLSGTYWYPPGTVVTAKTPLAPFRVPGKRRFFTSDDMRSWRALGYEYDSMANTYLSLLDPDPRTHYRYFIVLPRINSAQIPGKRVTVRAFVFSPGANAGTPIDGNPNFVDETNWAEQECMEEDGIVNCDTEGFTRVQLDLTPALRRLGRLKPAVQEAADPRNLGKGPALAKAPLRLQDIQLVVVDDDDRQLDAYRLGEVLLDAAWLNPVGAHLVVVTVQSKAG